MTRPFLLLSCALLLNNCTTSAPPSCPDPDLPCAATQSLVVLAAESEAASEEGADPSLIPVIKAAADQFARQFGHAVPATVVVPGGSVPDALRDRLIANGYVTLMPWVTADQKSLMRESAVRAQVMAQTEGLPPAVRDAALASAMAQLTAGDASKAADVRVEHGALAHELAHKWFIQGFAKAGEDPGGHAYGGWAPDWLDEAVAVSLENELLHERRRARFAQMDAARRIPLAEFLVMEHPAAATAAALAEATRPAADEPTSNRAILLSGDEAAAFISASGGDRAPDFYAQALRFTDYLQARTGSETVLAEIATALANGATVESWLSAQAGLPDTLVGLQSDWDDFAGPPA